MTQETWYRYEDYRTDIEGGDCCISIVLAEFRVVNASAKTVVLRRRGANCWPVDRYDKRVLLDARKRYAYPTKELAWDSYRHRKHHQKYYTERAHETTLRLHKMVVDGRMKATWDQEGIMREPGTSGPAFLAGLTRVESIGHESEGVV